MAQSYQDGEYIVTQLAGGAVVRSLPAATLTVQVRPRHVTEGAFKDRLGFGLVTGIAASTHPICIGVREMLNNRQFVDLDRPDLRTMLGSMAQAGLPEPVPGVADSGPITIEKAAIVIEAEVRDEERP